MIVPVRHIPLALLASVLATGIAVGQASLTAAQLAQLPSNARVRLDPLGTAVGAAALALTLLVYGWLGWAIVRRGGTSSAGVWAGLAAGLAAGLVGGLAQAHGVEDYLSRALGRVYVPAWFLPAALGLYAFLLTLFWALAGGAAAWIGGRAARRGGGPKTP